MKMRQMKQKLRVVCVFICDDDDFGSAMEDE